MKLDIYKLCADDRKFIDSFVKLPPEAKKIYEDILNDVCGVWEESEFDSSNFYYFKNDVLNIPAMIKVCQSVPEITMACALCALYDVKYYRIFDVGIEAQYKLYIKGHYRIMDFAIISDFGKPIVFVECDGYAYHASTREQFNYTQAKDREVQGLGFNVLHFTGSDINNDPMKCATEVFEFVKNNYSKASEITETLLKHGECFTAYDNCGKSVTVIPSFIPWNGELDNGDI